MFLADLEAEIKAEAWQGLIRQQDGGVDGDTHRYVYFFILKDVLFDDPNRVMSNVGWRIQQSVMVVDEGTGSENAYYEGIWRGPLFNAMLRWTNANIIYPQFVYRWKAVSTTEVNFTVMDVGSGQAVDTEKTGVLVDGELVVT